MSAGLQGITAVLIHSMLKILVLPKTTARTSFLLTFTHGPLRCTHTSTGAVCTVFIQTEKLMSSLAISFRLPLDTLVKLLLVFIFPCRRYTFKQHFFHYIKTNKGDRNKIRYGCSCRAGLSQKCLSITLDLNRVPRKSR